MQREELVEMMDRIPLLDHPKVQFVMRSGAMLSLDVLVRLEPTYLVMRGREAGNQDEGRAFFLPYADIQFLKIERSLSLAEMEAMFADRAATVTRPGRETRSDAHTETPPPTPAVPLDPAAIAKQNLLDRIRAAKSVVTAGRPQLK